jgi:hypothetical protein
MKILDALRNRFSHADAPGEVAGSPDEKASSPNAAELPFPGYDKLDDKHIGARLDELSQVELAAVESYERSHEDRPVVLDKLRYMLTSEPLPDYDTLSPEQIAEALADADAETVKAVRDYERKFGARPQVMEAAAGLLSEAKPSAGEDRAAEEKVERVKEGFENLDKTAEETAKEKAD